MATSFTSGGFNPRMIMGQPVFMAVAAVVVLGGAYLLIKNVGVGGGGGKVVSPSGQAAAASDTTMATGTMDQIQQQISVFEQQIASLPTTPHVPVSTVPVAPGVGGHSTT